MKVGIVIRDETITNVDMINKVTMGTFKTLVNYELILGELWYVI